MRELFPPGELTEFAGFVAAVNCGLVIGIMYDLFALLRKPFKSAVTTGIIDLLYYAAAVVLVALTLLYINCGTLRLYLCRDSIGNIPVCTFPGKAHKGEKSEEGKIYKKTVALMLYMH